MNLNQLKIRKIVFKNCTNYNSTNKAEILAAANGECKGYYDEDDCSFSCEGDCSGDKVYCVPDYGFDAATGILSISCDCKSTGDM